MTITVTAEDILHGVRHSCRFCPVARAIGREFTGTFVRVAVESVSVLQLVHGRRSVVTIDPPDACKDFIAAFDAGKDVKPFSFELDVSKLTQGEAE